MYTIFTISSSRRPRNRKGPRCNRFSITHTRFARRRSLYHREQTTFLEYNVKPAASHTFIVRSETAKKRILLCARPASECTLRRISAGNLTFRPSITCDNAHNQISLYATGAEYGGGSANTIGTWYFSVYDNDNDRTRCTLRARETIVDAVLRWRGNRWSTCAGPGPGIQTVVTSKHETSDIYIRWW